MLKCLQGGIQDCNIFKRTKCIITYEELLSLGFCGWCHIKLLVGDGPFTFILMTTTTTTTTTMLHRLLDNMCIFWKPATDKCKLGKSSSLNFHTDHLNIFHTIGYIKNDKRKKLVTYIKESVHLLLLHKLHKMNPTKWTNQ